MKRSVIFILFLTTIPDLFAVSYEDSGPYGSVGFSYLVDKYNDGESKRSQDKFLQEYKLGYGGIVYSPKLLDYKAEGILRYENISAKDDGYETKTKVDSKDYNVNLDFIKGSKIPFTVYAQKSEAPVSVVFANGFNRSLGGSESVGISGLVNLDIFDITYSTSNTSEKYESIFSTESRETQTHRTSLRKNEEAYNLQLNYSNINQTSERESTEGSSTTTNSLQDKVDLMYNWDISDSLTLNTSSNYAQSEHESTVYDSTDAIASATASLMWNPKTKHNGSINIQAFSITGDSYSTESMSISQNYGFEITKSLRFNQNTNYTTVNSGSMASENIGLGSGLSYAKEINKDTRINLSINVNGATNSNDQNSSLDSSTYSYGVLGSLNQNIDSIDSRLNANFGYNSSSSTMGSSSERYNAGLSLNTMFFTVVNNHLSTTYSREESILKYDNNSLSRSISRIDVNDNINYSVRVGIRGTLSTNVGISYSYIEYDTEIIARTIPKCDVIFGYALGEKWRFNSAFHVEKDLMYDVTNYNTANNLIFQGRSTKLSFGYNYNKATTSGYNYNKATTSGYDSSVSRDMHSIQAKVSRTF